MLEKIEGNGPAGVQRVFFREVLPGDRKKAEGKSNLHPHAGGGARDIRFNAKASDPLLKNLFPKRKTVVVRGARRQVRYGDVHWTRGGKDHVAELEYWPPTNARPSEGRIARIASQPVFAGIPPEDGQMVFLLLTQRADGTVWVRFATLKNITGSRADKVIGRHIQQAAAAKRGNRAVVGYLDFANGKRYRHD